MGIFCHVLGMAIFLIIYLMMLHLLEELIVCAADSESPFIGVLNLGIPIIWPRLMPHLKDKDNTNIA